MLDQRGRLLAISRRLLDSPQPSSTEVLMRLIGLVLALGLALAPLAAGAQETGKVYRIGWLNQGSADAAERNIRAFHDALKDLGYAEGQQYSVEPRHADGRTERLSVFAAELVALSVDVLVAPSTPSALAATQATRTIPIIVVTVADPVGSGHAQAA